MTTKEEDRFIVPWELPASVNLTDKSSQRIEKTLSTARPERQRQGKETLRSLKPREVTPS